jgi:DNA-binding IclR family transcriptional regulator
MADWTFMTNHAHVLFCLAQDPQMRLRDIAQSVRITERAVHRIVSELAADDYITITKAGRRNTYTLNPERRLRHPIESHHTVGELIDLVLSKGTP